MWSPADIADAAAIALQRMEAALREEEATHGLDDLPERALQAGMAQAFAEAGWTVAREVRYPSRRPASRAEGARCDIVLTRGAPLAPDAPPSLFDPVEPTPAEGACWIEVKAAAANDAEGPVARYARTLAHGSVQDAATLASEPAVHHGMLLLVLFGSDESALQRDLRRWSDDALASGLPTDAPRVRCFAIRERRGNGAAAVACIPVTRGPR